MGTRQHGRFCTNRTKRGPSESQWLWSLTQAGSSAGFGKVALAKPTAIPPLMKLESWRCEPGVRMLARWSPDMYKALAVVPVAALVLAGCAASGKQPTGSPATKTKPVHSTGVTLGTDNPPTSGVTSPPAGGGVYPTTPTSMVVPTTLPAATTPTSPPGDCSSGSTTVSVATPSPSPICVSVGSVVTITFDSSHAGIGVNGGWLGPAQVYPASILDVSSGSSNGTLLVVTAKALTPGMATVRAEFSQQCSSGDSTPCTIPPQGVLQLPITVVN